MPIANTSAFRASLALLACMSLAVATPTAAQTQSDSARADSAAQQLKAVTVSTSRSAGVVGGASAVVVKPDELRSSPAPLLDQALRESPFVYVRQNSRGEMEISVRGSDSRQAAVLVDGVPITLGWDHRTDPSLIPITGAERMVIVRGLGSVLNGPNTLGGSVEISHDPFGQPVGGRMWAGAGVDQYGSTVGTLGYGRSVANVGNGAVSFRTGIAHRQRDGVKLPADATDPSAKNGLRTGTDLKELDGFAALRWSNAVGRSLGVSVSGFDAEKGVPPEEHVATPRLWRYPYARRNLAMVSANTGAFSTPFGQGSLEVGAGYNAGKFKIETFADRTYSTVNGQELGDERTLITRALFTHSLGSATLKASYTGADIQYEETLGTASPANYEQKLRSTGVEIDAPVGGRTRVAAGVVFDNASTPETGGRTPGQEPFNNTGWRVGISHEVSTGLRLHTSVSERSRFPALRELYSGALDRFRPNPDLKPETLLGVEAGFTANQVLGRATQSSIQVVGFRHQLNDAVVRTTLRNPTRFMRVNRDRIASQGAELLAGLVFGADPDRAVSLNGDATLQSIKLFDQTANDAERHSENNPEMRGRLELGVPLPVALRAFATARYTGVQYCLNGGAGDELELKGQMVSDIAMQRSFPVASRGPFRWFRALLSLDNVGNTTVYDQCGLPQPGRTLRLTFTVR